MKSSATPNYKHNNILIIKQQIISDKTPNPSQKKREKNQKIKEKKKQKQRSSYLALPSLTHA